MKNDKTTKAIMRREEALPTRERVYELPGEVAVAVSAGRHQMLDGLIRRVKAGHVIEPQLIVGMIEVIRDLTKARVADNQRSRGLEVVTGSLMEELQVLQEKAKELRDQAGLARQVVLRLGSGDPFDIEDEIG